MSGRSSDLAVDRLTSTVIANSAGTTPVGRILLLSESMTQGFFPVGMNDCRGSARITARMSPESRASAESAWTLERMITCAEGRGKERDAESVDSSLDPT